MERFKLTLNKEYVMGFDPYCENSNSYSLGAISKPKMRFEIKKQRGFKRVVATGWSYVVELIK